MMKTNKILLLIVILLISVAAWVMINQNSSTIKKELRDFGVSDTSAIDKIFLADKQGHTALLQRQGPGQWTINGAYPARQDAINTLLKTIKQIEVRSPVGKAALQNILKNLSANSTKVEIYSKEKKIKVYYVGGPTQDMLGTYMYLENSTVPFIIHIPGFNGFLSTRYFADANDWRSRIIFQYGEGEIKSVTAQNNLEPDQSFRIEKKDDHYEYYPDIHHNTPSNIYQSQLVAYLAKYQMVGFERPTYQMNAAFRDSILATTPIRILTVESITGKKDSIIMFRKPVDAGTLTSIDETTGLLREFDPDRMYARWNNDSNLIVVQYHVFDKLFGKPDRIKGFGSF
jgi:hypothetical protein